MNSQRQGRDPIIGLVRAHGALTAAVVGASRMMSAAGREDFAAHLDGHRAQLNVAIGELALWTDSFGKWAHVDVGPAIHAPLTSEPSTPAAGASVGGDLLVSRERLKSRRTDVLAQLTHTRSVLAAVGLPADEITSYRRAVRLWAGEAIDVVTGAHRLILADQYIRSLEGLRVDSGRPADARRAGAALLRLWMADLEKADRHGELVFAKTCGYGDIVECYLRDAAR
jgi:hypothetical protein